MMVGAIEAGGTKFNCALGTGINDMRDATRIATTTADQTLAAVVAFFRKSVAEWGEISSLGLACFGPVDLDKRSSRYGHFLKTPKAHWSDVDIVGYLAENLGVPVAFDTDVNGAALGEFTDGIGQGVKSLVYITVGTGLGGGMVIDGKVRSGLIHPELGHMLLPRHPQDTAFSGCCPVHGDCLEGLASGVAMNLRWGAPAESLPLDHIAWNIEADYLAGLCMNVTTMLSPHRIILGGGVMHQPFMMDKVREVFCQKFNNYLSVIERAGGIENYIVAPGLGDKSGLAGAFCLARGI